MTTIGPRSRYAYTRLVHTEAGETLLAAREPFGFRLDPRNRVHSVIAGDTLWTLAERYFSGYADAADLWWIIADYQDPPLIDPTVQLEPGEQIVIPPTEALLEIFTEHRYDVPQVF